MALDHVIELARQAGNDDGVLHALQNDPVQISKPLDLSESQLRALISAGSFTTVRPVLTSSQPMHSLANQIATLDVGTLFPPEGQGELPTPGELPPIVIAPQSVPVAAPVAGIVPRPTVPSPAGGQAPIPRVPVAATPQPSRPPQAPTATPGVGPAPIAPVASTGTSQGGTQTTPSGTGGESGQTAQQSGQTSQESGSDASSGQQQGSMSGPSTGPTVQTMPASFVGIPAAGCCDACSTAMISIVAQLSTTAQVAITAITAVAGID